jgi:hypothetical protein
MCTLYKASLRPFYSKISENEMYTQKGRKLQRNRRTNALENEQLYVERYGRSNVLILWGQRCKTYCPYGQKWQGIILQKSGMKYMETAYWKV